MDKILLDANDVPAHAREFGVPLRIKCCARRHRAGSTAAYACAQAFKKRLALTPAHVRIMFLGDELGGEDVGGTD